MLSKSTPSNARNSQQLIRAEKKKKKKKKTISKLLLLSCFIYAYLFSPDEGSCCVFQPETILASNWVNLQSTY